MPTKSGGSAASEWVVGDLLDRGAIQPAAQAINAAQVLTSDVFVPGDDELTIEVDMTGGAIGDLTVAVFPFEMDGLTVAADALVPLRFTGPIFSTRVYYTAQFDVAGYDKVRISITNNNVGAQTITRSSWRLD